MNEEIKARIAAINSGIVPEGYKKTKVGIVPVEWEVCHFKTMFERLKRKNTEHNSNVLTISSQYGLINQEEFFNKSVASEDKSNYYLLYKGDFAYNKSYSNGYPFGAIKALEKYDRGVVSPLYICFTPTKKNKCPVYYLQYFENGLMNREMQAVAQEGARNHGLLNIGIEDFFNTYLVVPSLPEQQKIAEILSTQDKLIELKQKLLEQKKQQKKWLMQKLLDSCYKKYQHCEIIDIADYVDYRGKTPEKVENGILLITARNVRMGYIDYECSKEYVKESDYSIIMRRGLPKIGDVLITTEAPCGNVAQINNEKIALAQRIIKYRCKANYSNSFLCYILQSKTFQNKIEIMSTGGTAQGIKGSLLHKLKVPIVPFEVQAAIAEILSEQDKEIELLEKELEMQKQKKKALMQLLLTGKVRVKI